MPGVLTFQRPRHVAVIVDDVPDRGVASRMVRDVRCVLPQIVGGWQVSVRASARGRWRLELSGVDGRHVWIFAAPTAALSSAVVEKLEIFLRDSAAWHPLATGA